MTWTAFTKPHGATAALGGLVLATSALSACATGAQEPANSPASRSQTPAASPATTAPFDAAETLLCQGLTLDGKVLEFEDPDAWYLAQLREDGLVIMRPVPEEVIAQEGLSSTYREFREVRRVEGASNIPDGWYVMAGGS